MADADILFPLTLRKVETPTLRGLVIWNFSIWLILTKWQPIFQFFHNGLTLISHFCQHSENWRPKLGKVQTPTFRGLVTWNCSVWSILTKWQPFFYFFIMANADISFLSTLRKLETQTLGGSVIWNFSVRSILTKWQPFFNFFLMADTDIPFLLTLRKPETQTWGGQYFEIFLYNQYLMKWQLFFYFFIMADADIPFPSSLRKPETPTLEGQ